MSNVQCVSRHSCLKLARTDQIFVCGDGLKAKCTNKIVNSAALIKGERQDDLTRATPTITKRVEKCIEVDGGIFEHLLWTVAVYWDHLHNQ